MTQSYSVSQLFIGKNVFLRYTGNFEEDLKTFKHLKYLNIQNIQNVQSQSQLHTSKHNLRVNFFLLSLYVFLTPSAILTLFGSIGKTYSLVPLYLRG